MRLYYDDRHSFQTTYFTIDPLIFGYWEVYKSSFRLNALKHRLVEDLLMRFCGLLMRGKLKFSAVNKAHFINWK